MFAPFWYLDEIVRLHHKIHANDGSPRGEQVARTLALGSASLSLLRPDLPRAEHEAVLTGAFFHSRWAAIDERSLWTSGGPGESVLAEFLLATTRVADEGGAVARAAAGTPTVFCTAHLGSYRLLNLLLATAGVDFTLVVNSRTFAEQGSRFVDGWRAVGKMLGRAFGRGDDERQGSFTVLDAEAGNVGLRALRVLRRGGSLVFYVDGNTGVGGTARRDDKLIPVELLGQPLLARKGIAHLAHSAGAPIVPVFCERTGWLDRAVTFEAPLAAGGDREEHGRWATQAVYDRLGAYLRRVPEQWECWLHLHKWFDVAALRARATAPPPVASPADLLALNPDRYVTTRLGPQELVLDRATFHAFPLAHAPARHEEGAEAGVLAGVG